MVKYYSLNDIDTDINQMTTKSIRDFYLPYAIRFADDFQHLDTTNDWTATTGTGDSVALAGTYGGILNVTTAATANNAPQIQYKNESYKFISDIYYEVKCKVSSISSSTAIIGLCITDTTLIGGMSDGVYFKVTNGALSLIGEKDATETTLSTGITLVENTYYTLSFRFNTVTGIAVYVNDSYVGKLESGWVDDEDLAVSFAISTGANAAKTLSVDYVYVIQER